MLKFSVSYSDEKLGVFEDMFYGKVLEVYTDHIIVEHVYITSDENYGEKPNVQKRKLISQGFEVDVEKTPLRIAPR